MVSVVGEAPSVSAAGAAAAAVRNTVQRQVVLEVLRSSSDHPTASVIHARARARLPRVGAATVYRALRVLVDTGVARELHVNDEPGVRYDANADYHDHLVCESCGAVADLSPPVRVPRPAAPHAAGFEITHREVRFIGRCADCRRDATSSPPHPPTATKGKP